jgi:hypothetical protein
MSLNCTDIARPGWTCRPRVRRRGRRSWWFWGRLARPRSGRRGPGHEVSSTRLPLGDHRRPCRDQHVGTYRHGARVETVGHVDLEGVGLAQLHLGLRRNTPESTTPVYTHHVKEKHQTIFTSQHQQAIILCAHKDCNQQT